MEDAHVVIVASNILWKNTFSLFNSGRYPFLALVQGKNATAEYMLEQIGCEWRDEGCTWPDILEGSQVPAELPSSQGFVSYSDVGCAGLKGDKGPLHSSP